MPKSIFGTSIILCQAGLYDQGGSCQDCPEGFYCQGDGKAIACPPHSTTTTDRKVATDCICMAGYYYVSVNGSQDTNCRPCDPKSYKPNVGNGECPLTCPTNADSELASTSLADCFCEPSFYASIDSTTMRLARCIPCTFQGLDCRGGFENRSEANETSDRVHAMPVSLCLGVCFGFLLFFGWAVRVSRKFGYYTYV